MKIKKKYIGAKVYHAILNQHILIELGQEDRYEKLGLDIFVTPAKPKLVKRETPKKPKAKKNVKTTQRRNNDVHSDGYGTNDNNQS